MDIYENAARGRRIREVADADSVSYVVPTRGYNWFRWKGCRRSGQWIHGAEAETHCDALQVYYNGAWHPVVAFSHGYIGLAADYTVAGVKMFKEKETLKPCPFCGQEHTTITESNTEGIRIRCPNCNITFTRDFYEHRGELGRQRTIEAWNTRPE